jgi:signal recognition particle receptor subunit beta
MRASYTIVSSQFDYLHVRAQVEAAEELFEVLTHPSISRKKIPILLACNKMDLETEVGRAEAALQYTLAGCTSAIV